MQEVSSFGASNHFVLSVEWSFILSQPRKSRNWQILMVEQLEQQIERVWIFFKTMLQRDVGNITGECIIFNDFLPAQRQWNHYTPTITPHCLVIGRKLSKSQIIIRLWGELVAFGRFLDFQVSCIYVWFVNLIHKTSTIFKHVDIIYVLFSRKKFSF